MRIFNCKFSTSATLAGAAFVLALSPFGLSVAQDEDLSISDIERAAEVSIGAQFIDVDPNVKFDQAVLRVSGPNGYALTRTVSAEKGASYITADLLFDAEPARQGNIEEPLPWNHLPDGKYYFEIQFYSADGSTKRQSGSFKVESGTAVSPEQNPLSATHSNNLIERIAGTLLDLLVPSAHAQSVESHGVTGDFDDFVSIRNVTGTGTSRLNLNTTDSMVINADTWRVQNNADTNLFSINEGGSDNRLVILQGGNVGLGTDAPLSPLHINRDGGFQLRLTGSGADYRMDAFGTSLRIGHVDNTNQFRIFEDAVFNSLVVGSGGNIGIGTASPSHKLHVLGDDAGTGNSQNVQVLVQNSSGTAAPRNLFRLINNGNVGFQFINTEAANWTFAARSEGDFMFNRVGSGQIEFRVTDGGDIYTSGSVNPSSSRALKQDIADLDGQELLKKLDQLAVHEWSYTKDPDSRHIGPMAEDFYDVFRLGSSNKHISTTDMAGIALAAVKALKIENETLRTELSELRGLQERIASLESVLMPDSKVANTNAD